MFVIAIFKFISARWEGGVDKTRKEFLKKGNIMRVMTVCQREKVLGTKVFNGRSNKSTENGFK